MCVRAKMAAACKRVSSWFCTAQVCYQTYGRSPDVTISGDESCTVAYIPGAALEPTLLKAFFIA